MKYTFVLFALLGFMAVSCSDGVDKDAKNALDLMKKSMASTIDRDIEAADKYYQQYKEIEGRYKKTDKEKAFTEAYWKLHNENL